MSETTNYHLYLTDDESTRFIDWREKMNGTKDSNMIKIDKALSEKADNSQALTKTLFANRWDAFGSVFRQDIEIPGLTAEQNGIIGVAQNITEEQLESVREAGMYINQQTDNVLTIALDGEVPACDIPVVIILLG